MPARWGCGGRPSSPLPGSAGRRYTAGPPRKRSKDMAIQVGDRIPHAVLNVLRDGVQPVETSELFAGRKVVLFAVRSEEHTSELQSRENLVCRLLLEKKNTSHNSFCT